MTLKKVALIIEYEGTDFHGWQVQDTCESIQGLIEAALAQIFQREIRIVGAGRTDAGVHARCQVAHCMIDMSRPLHGVLRGLNSLLPDGISIIAIRDVPATFHARFDAVQKTYCYRIWNSMIEQPFIRRFCHTIRADLDVELMSRAAGYLIGTFDFQSFRAASCSAKSSIRTVRDCTVSKTDRLISIEITGTGFLQHMVRIIAGTLIEIGQGRRPVDDIVFLLKACDRSRAGFTAPARGLTLEETLFKTMDFSDVRRGLVW